MADGLDSMAKDLEPRSATWGAPPTVTMDLVRGMLEGARLRGRVPEPWLAEAGIAPQLLEQAGARVTTDQYIALIGLLIERLDDEALGFLARPLKRGSLMLLARSTLGAPDLEAAMRRVCHVLGLLQDDLEMKLVQDGPLAGLSIRLADAAWRPRFLHEFLVRVSWRLAAWLAGGSLKALRFDFAFEAPSYVGEYAATFPAPLRFGQAASGFWFDARRLARTFGRDEAALRAFVASWPASVIVPRRAGEGIVARVHAHLARLRPHWPGLEATAAALHMSAPTLQRHLAAAGTSFQAVKDALRRDIAIARLSTSSVSFGELAAELGFADAPAFQRAFKGWTGSPPGAYRVRFAVPCFTAS